MASTAFLVGVVEDADPYKEKTGVPQKRYA